MPASQTRHVQIGAKVRKYFQPPLFNFSVDGFNYQELRQSICAKLKQVDLVMILCRNAISNQINN